MLSYALLVVLASDNFDRTAVKMHFTIPRMIATSSFHTALEYTKFVLAGVSPRTPLGELTVLPQTV